MESVIHRWSEMLAGDCDVDYRSDPGGDLADIRAARAA